MPAKAPMTGEGGRDIVALIGVITTMLLDCVVIIFANVSFCELMKNGSHRNRHTFSSFRHELHVTVWENGF